MPGGGGRAKEEEEKMVKGEASASLDVFGYFCLRVNHFKATVVTYLFESAVVPQA